MDTIALTIEDNCIPANELRAHLLSFIKDSAYISTEFVQLTNYLSANCKNSECNFPRTNQEQRILLEFSERLFEVINEYEQAILLACNLREYFPNNVEFTEHIYELIPRIATQNTLLFTQVVNSLEGDPKEKMIGELELFYGKGALKYFANNLMTISDTNLSSTITEMIQQIEKEYPGIIEWK